MTTLTPQAIQSLQDEWNEARDSFRSEYTGKLSAMRRIEKKLTDMGLDLAADESYDLLQSGLTRSDFQNIKTLAVLAFVLDTYHLAQRISVERGFGGQAVAPHYHQLDRLQRLALPMFEAAVAETGLPAEINRIEAQQLDFIRQIAANGLLLDEVQRAANDLAQDHFRTAKLYAKTIESKKSDVYHVTSNAKNGLSYVKQALELIDKAGAHYAPCDIPDGYGEFYGFSKTTMPYSREAAEDMRRDFVLKQSGGEFIQAKKFHDQGHYVLDASGSGHGMMVMPIQDILQRLEEGGFDIRDPKTFTAMGTDIETVWACYRTERAHTQKQGQHVGLIRPELAR